jgi:hypothetical protein
MQDEQPVTWFMSRRVPLPLEAAAVALDELVEHRRRDAPPAAVALTDELEVWPVTPLPGGPRRLGARLRVSGLARTLPVELELAPWSRLESEVGLRPTRRVGPARAERYWSGGADALDAVRRALPWFVPAPAAAYELLAAS